MSFARTKIQLPRPRAGLLLARPALEQALRSALIDDRVVLVCAPAGYGKTALLGRAIEQLPADHAVAWISVDEGDDLQRLLACLTAALEPFDPPWRTSPEGLAAAAVRPGAEAQQAVADEIVNTLDACEVAHGVIALDDLHHVGDPACLVFLEHWLQHLSPRWTVAIAARHEPPLRLARLRARGLLADFREAQLRFGRDEVRELAAGAGLDAGTADALHARTAGWAAGLRLALNGARGGHPGSAIDRHAFEFLTTEVLARIDPGLRDFLLVTSMLQDLDPARCAAVSGDAGAAQRLEEIQRLGLFATVVDERQPTLRLHDLFREALQHRLRIERRDDWPALMERAAAVETDPVRCQALLLAAGRYAQAAKALLVAGVPLTTLGGKSTLLHLVEQFPPAFAETSADWQRVAGMAKWNVWETRAAERHFALADELFAARGDAAAAQVARAHRSITLIGLGRLSDAGALIDSLEAQPLEGEARIVALLARTWHTLERCSFDAVAPRFEALVQALEARPLLEIWFFTVPPPRQTSCRGIARALARWATGALAVTEDRPVPLRAMALLTQGWLAFWQGRLDDAQEHLLRAEADVQWTGHQIIARAHSLGLRGMLTALRGDAPGALETMRTRLSEHPPGYGDWGLWHLLFFAGRIAAACGDAALLREWLQRQMSLQPGLPDVDPPRLRPAQALHGTLAWLEGRRGEAIAAWRAGLEHEDQIDLLGQAADVRVRLAAAEVEDSRLHEAAALLDPLLAPPDAVPGGALLAGSALRMLANADWGATLPASQRETLLRWDALLRAVAGAGDRSAPAAGDAFAATAGATAPAGTAAIPDDVTDTAGTAQRGAASIAPATAGTLARALPARPGGDPLTAREREVLAQIADGASNKVIARALDLSPHTVKRHVAHILDKLTLASRGQAAAWYRSQATATPPAARATR